GSFYITNYHRYLPTYTLSLHDALPIYFDISGAEVGAFEQKRLGLGNRQRVSRTVAEIQSRPVPPLAVARKRLARAEHLVSIKGRSEEHTSELQSRENLVCRLLLEKKKK